MYVNSLAGLGTEGSSTTGKAMAAKSVKPPRKLANSRDNYCRNPKLGFALCLILADAFLVALIIAYVPCKIEFLLISVLLKMDFRYILLTPLIVWFQILKLIGTLTCRK